VTPLDKFENEQRGSRPTAVCNSEDIPILKTAFPGVIMLVYHLAIHTTSYQKHNQSRYPITANGVIKRLGLSEMVFFSPVNLLKV
jgi:hypothetical protein